MIPITRLAVAALAAAVLILSVWGILFFGQPGLVAEILGTGGYVSQTVTGTPHTFSFERPRFWNDSTAGNRSSGEYWLVIIQGPTDKDRVRFADLKIRVAASLAAGGYFASADELSNAILPDQRVLIAASRTQIAGKEARVLEFTYTFWTGPPARRLKGVPSRGNALFFEDRDYLYEISYSAADADYNHYTEVFERMLSSFRFLD